MVSLRLRTFGEVGEPFIKFIRECREVLGAEVTFYLLSENGKKFGEVEEGEFMGRGGERGMAVCNLEFPGAVDPGYKGFEKVGTEGGEYSVDRGEKEVLSPKQYDVVFVNVVEFEYGKWGVFSEKYLKGVEYSVGVLILPDKMHNLKEVQDYKKVMWNLQNSFNLSLSFVRETKRTLPQALLLTLMILSSAGVVNIDGADLEYFCRGGLTLIPLTGFSEGEGDLPSRVMREIVLGYMRTLDFRSIKGAVVNVFTSSDIPLKDVMRVVEGVKRLIPRDSRIIAGINVEEGERRLGVLVMAGLIPNELLMHLYAT